MEHSVFRRDAMAGRVYGVTGAAHGIGRATARALRSVGAEVLAIDLNGERLATLAEECGAVPLAVDVTDTTAVARGVADVVARFGRVDGWVNNAMFGRRLPLETQPAGDMEAAWRVNVQAAWEHCRIILPHLKSAGGGSIVNLSSVMAHAAVPGTVAYVSAKAAVQGLTRALAVELAPHRIRANAIAPGYILTYSGTESNHPDPAIRAKETELRRRMEEVSFRIHHPWPEYGRPEDIADAVVFLLSDAARFVTGSVVTVDGGFSVDLHATDERLARGHAELEGIREELRALGVSPKITY